MANKTTPAPTHPCNVPGCRQRIRREHWACHAHWWIVPLSKRNRLSRAWQALKAARESPHRTGCYALQTPPKPCDCDAPRAVAARLDDYRTAEKAILEFFAEGKTDATR